MLDYASRETDRVFTAIEQNKCNFFGNLMSLIYLLSLWILVILTVILIGALWIGSTLLILFYILMPTLNMFLFVLSPCPHPVQGPFGPTCNRHM